MRRAVAAAAAALTFIGGAAAAANPTAAEASRPARRAVGPEDTSYTYTVGPFVADYVPPPPGSYSLPVIERVSDHPVFDSGGNATTLRALQGDRLAVVAFVYT